MSRARRLVVEENPSAQALFQAPYSTQDGVTACALQCGYRRSLHYFGALPKGLRLCFRVP
jgi:hypothetical protein